MGSITELRGAKGGSTPKTPTEAPDTLRSIAYFRLVDLVGEGEIGGLVNGLQSVYLDQTPVANADGSLNFTGVHVDQRTGSQDQDYIPGYASVEDEISVGLELKSDSPWVQNLNNIQLSAVRITLAVQGLQKTDTSSGNIVGYSIQYAIDVATDGGDYQTVLTSAFTGKTTSEYQRSHRIDLPKASAGWNVRVRRLTANANSATVADTTQVSGYTEIIDAKLRYPNSALVAISGDASQFSNIPARAYDLWGRIVQVPGNYDPTSRSYSGTWDGSFKAAWTDNPAWVYYDIATNDRFGLGDLLDASLVDKWELYRIAQYCDQLVPDGKGGTEPRFTCNCFLQSQEDAYKLLSDLASIFRGVSYWMGGTITPSADMPADPVYTYTAANVVGGTFTYQSSSRKTRYTTALVTWNDPSNFYNQAVEYCEDRDGLARYGINQTEFVAFGCTSQGQAQRAGQWALLTSRLETDSVSFQVGLDGLMAAPGQIIRIQDPARSGRRQGGRIATATAASITVDKTPDECAPGDTLTVNMPDGSSQTQTVSAVDGTVLTVAQPFTEAPAAQAAWTVESGTLAAQTFRVTNVTEDASDTGISFTITAVQHVAGKFAAIDDGTVIQIPPISKLPNGLQAPPTNVQVDSHVVVTQGIATNVMTISWDPPAGAANYKVEWQKDNGQWVPAGTVSTASLDVAGIYTGNYLARVTAFNTGNVASVLAYSGVTAVAGKTGAPPTLTMLTATSLAFGIRLAWGFPAGAEDTQRTEIWYSQTPDLPAATKLGDYAYPGDSLEMHGLAAGASFFFWGRLVDKTGNIGPWYPTTGAVNGQSISDPNLLQDYWKGTIGRSALQADLLADIDAAAALKDFVDAPAYDATQAYDEGDIVASDGQLYRSTQAVPAGTAPPDADYWQDVGDEQQTAYGLVAALHDTNLKLDDLNGEVEATATKTDGLYVQLNPKSAGELTDDGDGSAGDWTTMENAGYYSYTIAQVTGDLALSQRIDTWTATIGDLSASVETNAQAMAHLDGEVSSSYSIKTQVAANGQRYLAGIAIGVDYSGGDVTSQVLVNAGTFAVFDASSGSAPETYPFVIQGGQTFINQAFIGNGWITNAMIGSVIQSDNYDGTNGWRIDKSGSAYFGGDVTIHGNVTASSITGNYQRTVSNSWSGSIIGTDNSSATNAVTLLAPYRSGETHVPIVQAMLGFENMDDNSKANADIVLEISTDGGGVWTTAKKRFYTLPSSASSTEYFQFTDSARSGSASYRFRTAPPDDGSHTDSFVLNQVEMLVIGIK